MEDENNPFEDYYAETSGDGAPNNNKTGGNDEFLRLLEQKEPQKNVSADAAIIREPINLFIKNLTALIDKAFANEKEKGTRLDLIVTLVVGGIAFTLANVYYLIVKNLKIKMSPEQYEKTFMGMYRSALRDINPKGN